MESQLAIRNLVCSGFLGECLRLSRALRNELQIPLYYFFYSAITLLLLCLSSLSSKCSFLYRYLIKKCEITFSCLRGGECDFYSILLQVSTSLFLLIRLREVLRNSLLAVSIGGNLALVYFSQLYQAIKLYKIQPCNKYNKISLINCHAKVIEANNGSQQNKFQMIENSRVIPEAQQALQQSLMMSATLKPATQAPPSIKDLSRDVDKLISRFPSQFSQLLSIDLDNHAPEKEEVAAHQTLQEHTFRPFISKYNYTGKMYRFEKAEKELEIPKPEVQPTKTEVIEPTKAEMIPKGNKQQTRSIYKSKDSVLAEDSFERSEVKFPSHNYYIVFDNKNKKERHSHHDKMSKTAFLEKKVRRLEEEVKEIKYNSGKTTTGSFRKDGRIKLEALLDSIIG